MTLACLAGKISHFQNKISFFKLGDQTVLQILVKDVHILSTHGILRSGGGGGVDLSEGARKISRFARLNAAKVAILQCMGCRM